MPNLPHSHENSEPAELRQARIDFLLQNYRQSLVDYAQSNEFRPQSLDLPKSAARAFVPRRILELASVPENVDILLNKGIDPAKRLKRIEYGIVERNAAQPFFNAVSKKEPGFDWVLEQVEQNTKIFVRSTLVQAAKPDVLVEGIYVDNPELRHPGMGTSFSANLREVAKILGFRFLRGRNNPKNASFYLGLGFKKIEDLPEDQQKYLMGDAGMLELSSYDVYTQL